MPLVVADRVRETTTTAGTGTITLAGAVTGYQSFSAIGNGNTTYYAINAGSQWEVGIGTYLSAGPTLSRDTVLESSNSGSLVNFSAGTKDVFVTYPAEKSISDGYGLLPIANGGTGTATAFTAGSVVFAGASGVYAQDNANLFWDDTNNRLGIGTTAPGYRLDVSSADTTAGFGYAMRLRSNATATAAALQFTNSAVSVENGLISCTDAGLLTVLSSSAMAFRTNGAERARIDSAGNVGIGTSSPSAKFEVVGNVLARADNATGNSNLITSNTNAGNNTTKYTSLLLQGTDTVGTAKSVGLVLSGPSDANYVASYMAFSTRSADALSERMRIDSSGNVGIGTSSPAVKLDVNGSINFGQTLISGGGVSTGDCAFELGGNRSASGNAYMDFHATAGTDFESRIIRYGGTNGGMDIINAGTGGMVLSVSGFAPMAFQTNGTERVRVGGNGTVNIGGTGGDATFMISQALGGFNRLTQMSPSGTSLNAFNLMAGKNAGGGDVWWSWGVRPDNFWCIIPGVDSAFTSSFGFYFDSTGGAYKSGGGTWAATSDRTVKTNITPIADAARRIMALKPSSFDYRAPEAHAGRVSDRGFIAQDFEEVYPHSVSESSMIPDGEASFFAEGEKVKMVGLNNDFFADLVALMQEQQTTINDLRARVAQLEGN